MAAPRTRSNTPVGVGGETQGQGTRAHTPGPTARNGKSKGKCTEHFGKGKGKGKVPNYAKGFKGATAGYGVDQAAAGQLGTKGKPAAVYVRVTSSSTPPYLV